MSYSVDYDCNKLPSKVNFTLATMKNTITQLYISRTLATCIYPYVHRVQIHCKACPSMRIYLAQDNINYEEDYRQLMHDCTAINKWIISEYISHKLIATAITLQAESFQDEKFCRKQLQIYIYTHNYILTKTLILLATKFTKILSLENYHLKYTIWKEREVETY